jgi:hypothetical protein
MSGVYFAYFSNRVLKVGMSTGPAIRVLEIKKIMQKEGAALVDSVIFNKIRDARKAEVCLINTMVRMGKKGAGKEWFYDIDFSEVRPALENAVTEEIERQNEELRAETRRKEAQAKMKTQTKTILINQIIDWWDAQESFSEEPSFVTLSKQIVADRKERQRKT